MASLIAQVVDGYNRIWELRDPRVENWLFLSSPLPTLFMCLGYVFIVKVLGPAYMKNRPAYQFRKTLIVYNFIQVIFSAWLFYEYGRGGWFHGYSFQCQPVDYSYDEMAIRIGMSGWFNSYSYRCQPVDYSDSPLAMRMVHACWWYYFSKFTEFFDTFFFVLRKKQEQVSVLHVVHHGIMPMSVWFGLRFTPGGHSTFFGLLNTLVHVVMYFYYMVSAMGPKYQKFIWWKKYLTAFQMTQFIAIMVHAFQLLFVDCNYPKAFVWWIGCHGVLFFALFSDFYKRSYKSSKQSKDKALKNGHANGHAVNGHAITNGKSHAETNGHSNGYSNGSAVQSQKKTE